MLYLRTNEVFNMEEKLNNELENEQKVDENPSEEVKSSIDDLLDKTEEITKMNISSEELYETVEPARKELLAMQKKNTKISRILMLIAVAIIIAGTIFIAQEPLGFKIGGYVLLGAAILGMIIFYVLTRNKFPAATKKYISIVTTSFNGFIYKATEYSDIKTDLNDRYEISDLIVDGVYQKIDNIASRNIVKGKFMDSSFKVGDVALYETKGKDRKTLFVGKHLASLNDLTFEDRFIIHIKGEKEIDTPTALNEMVTLNDDPNFIIYGKEGADYKSVLGTKFISELKKIELDETLLAVSFVFWGGHTAVYLSYSDVVISLPFEFEFQVKPMEDAAKLQLHLLGLLKEIGR